MSYPDQKVAGRIIGTQDGQPIYETADPDPEFISPASELIYGEPSLAEDGSDPTAHTPEEVQA